jgi:hypothetical protein
MALSTRANKLVAEITNGNVKLGDLKKRGKEIKKDHDLAMELWSTGDYYPRLLSILIFDKKLLTENVINQIASDMLQHDAKERNQLTDWLLANQLAQDKKLASLVATWEKNPSPILRRLFWYHQARLRWTGQTPPDNSANDTRPDERLHIWDTLFRQRNAGKHPKCQLPQEKQLVEMDFLHCKSQPCAFRKMVLRTPLASLLRFSAALLEKIAPKSHLFCSLGRF